MTGIFVKTGGVVKQAASVPGSLGFQWRGAWVSGTNYIVNDIVTRPGGLYRRKTIGAGATAPESDATNWDVALTDIPMTVNGVAQSGGNVDVLRLMPSASTAAGDGTTGGKAARLATFVVNSAFGDAVVNYIISVASTPTAGYNSAMFSVRMRNANALPGTPANLELTVHGPAGTSVLTDGLRFISTVHGASTTTYELWWVAPLNFVKAELRELARTSGGTTAITYDVASAWQAATTTALTGPATVTNPDDVRFQPLDADLTAIAAVATATYGRSLLSATNAAGAAILLGLAAVATSGSASDLGAGTLADARLPVRLAPQGINIASISITDMNNVTTGGFYTAINTTANTPVAGNFFAFFVSPYSTANYCMQLATDVNTRKLYVRTDVSGTWGAWSELQTKATADALYQPLDSDLTAIAALSTTTFGRNLLALADAAAGLTAFGAQPLDSDLTAIAAIATTSFGRSLLALTDGAATVAAIGAEPAARAIDVKTGAYTLVLGDAIKVLHFNHATTPAAFTIPPNSSVAFPIGTYLEFCNINVADLQILAGAGVTLNSPNGLYLRDQWATAGLRKTATDTWVVMGRTTT